MNRHVSPELIEVSADTRYGTMSYFADDQFIGRSLELYGEYSPDETALLRKLVKPGWKVVNGGANIGTLVVPLSEMVGDTGWIYAFEPQPETHRLLVRNTPACGNVLTSDYALGRTRGDTSVQLYKDLDHSNYGHVVVGEGDVPVRQIALDDWLQGENIDLIFLDIEGGEIAALEGAHGTIKRCRPLLYLEDHPDSSGGSDLQRHVRRLDYLCYSHQPSLYSPDNWKGNAENVFGRVASFNILCIPKERLGEFRSVVDDQAKFYLGRSGSKLQMLVPSSPRQSASGWAAVVRCGGVGDNLITASVCKPLKEAGYKVEVITQKPHDVLFDNNPYIDKISAYEAKDWPTDIAKWQDMFVLRAKEYDRFANLSHSCECRHALLPIQTWYWWPQEYRRKLCGGNYLETVHDIVGVPYSFGPLFFPTEEEREHASVTRNKLGKGPVIAWCLSGTRIDKVYPYAPLVIARLIKELGAQVVMMGAPPPHRDAEIAKMVMDNVRAQNGTLDGLTHAGSPSMDNETWPIRRIITFAMNCDLYIGADTGPSWGVAFEQIPKIIMVSHASAENITKHWINTTTLQADGERVPCHPCHRLHDTFATCNAVKINNADYAACMSDISAETIVTTARRLLNGT